MEKAIYKIDDVVEFDYWDGEREKIPMSGKVVVVDRYGTFFNPDEPSYDVQLECGTWVKHIPQSVIKKKI